MPDLLVKWIPKVITRQGDHVWSFLLKKLLNSGTTSLEVLFDAMVGDEWTWEVVYSIEVDDRHDGNNIS